MCCSRRTDLWFHVCSPHTDTGHMHKHGGLLISCFSHAKQLRGADFGGCNKVSIPSAEPADVTLETRSCERVRKHSSTVKHQDTLCSCDTLLFIFSIFHPLLLPPSTGALLGSLAEAAPSRKKEKKKKKKRQRVQGPGPPDRSPSWSQPPNMLSWPALGTAKWFCSCPFVPLP